MLIFMRSDTSSYNENAERVEQKDAQIKEIIFQSFSGVVSKRSFFGVDIGYDIEDTKRYNEIYPQVEYLIDHPYVLGPRLPLMIDLGIPDFYNRKIIDWHPTQFGDQGPRMYSR